ALFIAPSPAASVASILHLVLHALAPLVLALLLFRARWRRAAAIMLATRLVDVDHLLAEPVYDPQRCSIGFHPLHTAPAIAAWGLLTALPSTRIAGTGLLLHMALDA